MGIVGSTNFLSKFLRESKYVNGINIVSAYNDDISKLPDNIKELQTVTDDYEKFLDSIDALYIISAPSEHYWQIKKALEQGKHVLCESPITVKASLFEELQSIAKKNNVILMTALRVAFSMAYSRLLLLIKGGVIGKVVSVDTICTSLRNIDTSDKEAVAKSWNSICSWGPTAMLPIFQILGKNYNSKVITSNFADREKTYDNFTKISFIYPEAVASLKVGLGVKSEG